ncbi:hypothetical protein Taro_025620 [Colocasia esculenta]|uniref:Auxilin-related protein 2 n=1 Tax=Colocasia esculenta TaxID=4460 RepID=A0A843VAN3_COLES|nr:hypothetical protein [Colocasia esculenta]
MDEFPGLLSRDFGLRPQGKAAPMSASKSSDFGSASGFGSTGGGMGFPADLLGGGRRDDGDDIFFGGGGARAQPPKYVSASAGFASDPFFSMGAAKTESSPSVDAGFSASMPVYDKPVYDDDDGDIFSGVPGMKKSSSASAAARKDVFSPPAYEDDLLASLGGSRPASRGPADSGRPGAASGNASPTYGDDDLLSTLGRSGGSRESGAATGRSSPPYDDDLLANIGGGRSFVDEKRSGSAHSKHSSTVYEDDLLAGFSGVPKRSSDEGRSRGQGVSGFDELIPGFGGSGPPKQKRVTLGEDPFVVLESTSAKAHSSSGLSTDPLEHINKPSGSLKSDGSSAKAGVLFDDINGFDGFMKSLPSFSSDIEDNKDRSPLETIGKVSVGEPSTKSFDNIFPRTVPDDRSHQTMFEKPSKSSESFKSVHINGLNFDANVSLYDASTGVNATQNPEEQHVMGNDVWLTVSEIPLFTQPTSAPPPSRPPPPLAFRSKQAPFTSQSKVSPGGLNTRRKVSESSFPQPTESYQFHSSYNDLTTRSAVSSLDELEEFAMGKPHGYANEAQAGEEENEANSTAAASAAAMKQAMDRAEAKFKHAREVRERERDLKSSKNKETPQHLVDEDEKEKERLDREREQSEREKEQRRLEKMRELELEREREREKARQAVERATREARERAAVEARQRAEKVAREQAERAAVQRVQSEARERAAAEARDRAEKLAAERERAEAEARERAARERAAERERAEAAARERVAREKAAMGAREKAERAAVERAAAEARARAQRAAVERATAEARERAAVEARERAASMAREKQQKNENDLSSFFGMGARATSAPKERAAPSATSPNDEFQEIEGEPEERRRARLEREQRARERVAKALAEKNEREMQMQRDQAERDRISDTLNMEIRRWAAGKQGNLRALLSTLQYVLWPESGWQPVSLTDLITAASVKKVYRKATLCVHPDKVVNGTVQQKYVAEQVFDLLKIDIPCNVGSINLVMESNTCRIPRCAASAHNGEYTLVI